MKIFYEIINFEYIDKEIIILDIKKIRHLSFLRLTHNLHEVYCKKMSR